MRDKTQRKIAPTQCYVRRKELSQFVGGKVLNDQDDGSERNKGNGTGEFSRSGEGSLLINSGREAPQSRIETCRNNNGNTDGGKFLRRNAVGRVRGSDWQMPAFNPAVSRPTRFINRTETKINACR